MDWWILTGFLESKQLPVRVSTTISGLTSLPSGNGRLSGSSTARVEWKEKRRSSTVWGTGECKEKSLWWASVDESVEMLEEQRFSSVCWKHRVMRTCPVCCRRVSQSHTTHSFQHLILWKNETSTADFRWWTAGRDSCSPKSFQHEVNHVSRQVLVIWPY